MDVVAVICCACGNRGHVPMQVLAASGVENDLACSRCGSTDLDALANYEDYAEGYADGSAASQGDITGAADAGHDNVDYWKGFADGQEGGEVRAVNDPVDPFRLDNDLPWGTLGGKLAADERTNYECKNCGKEITHTSDGWIHVGGDAYCNQNVGDAKATPKEAAKTGIGELNMPPGKVPEDFGVARPITESLRCSNCLTEFSHVADDPATPMPTCPNCGSDAVTAAGTVTPTENAPKIAYDEELRNKTFRCSVCGESYKIGDGSDHDHDEVSRRHKSGVREKVQRIATSILADNPGLGRATAINLAYETVRRYPKVAGLGKTAEAEWYCPSCDNYVPNSEVLSNPTTGLFHRSSAGPLHDVDATKFREQAR